MEKIITKKREKISVIHIFHISQILNLIRYCSIKYQVLIITSIEVFKSIKADNFMEYNPQKLYFYSI